MADDPLGNDTLPEEAEFEGPALPRRPVRDTAEMDITPMIDITFLLLIFFLVCSTASPQTALELPPARHGSGVSDKTSVIITVARREGAGPPRVYLADGRRGTPLSDDEELQSEAVTRAVREGVDAGKSNVLIKAERGVKHGQVWRVETAAGQVEGIRLHVAVMEIE
jgi:biopolymer transport protein ExbD